MSDDWGEVLGARSWLMIEASTDTKCYSWMYLNLLIINSTAILSMKLFHVSGHAEIKGCFEEHDEM